MTKSKSWICDICKKEFHPNDSGYGTNIELKIIIPFGGQYENDTKYDFEDTCLDCRLNIVAAVDRLIKK